MHEVTTPLRTWIAKFVDLVSRHHTDAYKDGLEDARNVVERVAMMPWRSPSMDDATLAAWRDCADYIAGRINDLIAARSGREQGADPVASSHHLEERA